MNWVKPEFGDFLCPPRKKVKTDEEQTPLKGAEEKSISYERQSDIAAKLGLLGRYFPKTKDELVVNKKKIEELEFWITNLQNESTYLLLTGPPGCGKLRTLAVLCKTHKIDLIEWTTPMSHSYDPDNYNPFYQNELEAFEDFIVRSTRYTNVLTNSSKRIVVIKDVPNGFIKDKSCFHSFLERYFNIEKLRIVFIVSDVSLCRDLFPENIKMNFFVKNINFNPITQRNVATALQNLVKKMELTKINPKVNDHVEKISLDCNGDLRNALATLQFFLAKGNFDNMPLPSTKKKRTKGAKQKKDDKGQSSTASDNKIDIFHGLGRVLYAKREAGKLVHSAQDVADSFISSPQLFIGMLHENYLNTFSTIHDVQKASTNLAVSDLLLQDWNTTSEVLGIGVTVGSYGLMVTNSTPIKKFQQFNKPRSKFTTKVLEKKDLIESAYPFWKTSDVATDIAPFVKYMPKHEFSHRDILLELGKFQ